MTVPVQHKLSPDWAQHAAEVISQIKHADEQAWILEGQAAHNRREAETMRKHLVTVIDQIRKVEKLPPSLKPYALSADCSALIGEVDIQQEKTDGVADSTE
jgi:hypothetical protein